MVTPNVFIVGMESLSLTAGAVSFFFPQAGRQSSAAATHHAMMVELRVRIKSLFFRLMFDVSL